MVADKMATPAVSQPASRPARWLLPAALVLPTVLTLVYFVWMAGASGPLQQMVFGTAKLSQFLLPVLWWHLRGRPPIARWTTSRGRLLAGLGLGLAMAAVMVAAALVVESLGWFEAAKGVIHGKLAGVGVHTSAQFAGLALFYCLAHSLLEEYYFRWFVWGVCRERLPRVPAHLLAAVGFMGHHIVVLAFYFGGLHPLTWLGSLAVGVAGLVWSWLAEATDSLWPAWIAHVIADAAIFGFGYHLLTFPIPTS